MRFDWYAATLPHGTDAEQAIDFLASRNALGDIVEGRPRFGYEACTILRDGEGERWCDVLHGGANGVQVTTSGEVAPEVVNLVRSAWPVHQVARADVCEDLLSEEPGLFGRVHPQLQQLVQRHGRVRADTIMPDDRDLGATYRIGSRTSETSIRVYQKPEQLVSKGLGESSLRFYFDRWVRFEIEAKPQKENRFAVASMPEEQVWALSRIGREVSKLALGLSGAKSGVSHYKPLTQRERARRHCAKMFGNTLREWRKELGSRAEVGIALFDLIEELERERARRL